MARAEVTLREKGLGEILKSDRMVAEMGKRGDRVARAAGPGFESDAFVGRTRARAMVRARTFIAELAERKDKVLTRAIDAARG